MDKIHIKNSLFSSVETISKISNGHLTMVIANHHIQSIREKRFWRVETPICIYVSRWLHSCCVCMLVFKWKNCCSCDLWRFVILIDFMHVTEWNEYHCGDTINYCTNELNEISELTTINNIQSAFFFLANINLFVNPFVLNPLNKIASLVNSIKNLANSALHSW